MTLRGLIAASLIVFAQTPIAVPVDQEPQHKVVFKNEFERILDATLPSGYITLNHSHDVDNVSVTISNGRDSHASGWVEVTVAGGKGPGASVWRDAGTSSSLSATGAPLEIVEIEPK